MQDHYFIIYNSNIHDIHFLHTGHQHNKAILFCCCEDDAVTLLKLQLWPGSITRPLVAFHFKLVMLAESLLLECHVSLKKFCDMLGLNKSTMLPKWVCISLQGLVLKQLPVFLNVTLLHYGIPTPPFNSKLSTSSSPFYYFMILFPWSTVSQYCTAYRKHTCRHTAHDQ